MSNPIENHVAGKVVTMDDVNRVAQALITVIEENDRQKALVTDNEWSSYLRAKEGLTTLMKDGLTLVKTSNALTPEAIGKFNEVRKSLMSARHVDESELVERKAEQERKRRQNPAYQASEIGELLNQVIG